MPVCIHAVSGDLSFFTLTHLEDMIISKIFVFISSI